MSGHYQPDEKKILPHNNLKQAASLMAITGLMDPQQACDEVVSVGGGKGFSTFYGYYMLEALAKAGEYEKAIDIINTFWGAMLDLGATTFWEDFNLDWIPNAAPIDEPVPAGKKTYMAIRRLLLSRIPSQPLPRVVFRTYHMAVRSCIRYKNRGRGTQADQY